MSAAGDSFLGRMDARPKLLATVGFLLALGLIPTGTQGSWFRLAALGTLLAAVLIPDGVWLRRTFWLRLAPVAGLTAGMALLIVLTRRGGAVWPLLDVGGWQLSLHEAGLRSSAELALRTALAASALVTLSVRSSGPSLLNALAFYRLPRIFLAVLGSVARSLWIVTDEARRMNRARLMRGAGATLRARVRVVGGMIGSLLVRSMGRAERVHRAMLARGYDADRAGGPIPQLESPPLRPMQFAACLGFVALSLATRWSPLP